MTPMSALELYNVCFYDENDLSDNLYAISYL